MTTYPPAHHIVRDLRIAIERPQPGHSICRCPVVPAICHNGQPRVGVLAALLDIAGAGSAIGAVAPDWIATSDLSCTVGGAIGRGPIIVTARVVRVGSNIVVVRGDFGDGDGSDDPTAARPAGVGIMKFARIPGSATEVVRHGAPQDSRVTYGGASDGITAPVFHQIGLRYLDASRGIVEIAKTDYVRNSFGSLNGGVLTMVVEAAAEAACGRGFQACAIEMHYLAQTKAGPARTRTRVVSADAHSAAVEVETYDTGNNDSLLTIAMVRLIRCPH